MIPELRKDKRWGLKFPMSYTILSDGEEENLSVSTFVSDLSLSGVSFFAHEKITKGLRLKISFSVSSEQTVSFGAKVVRVSLIDESLQRYVVGVKIDDINDKTKQDIDKFLKRVDIYEIFNQLDLKNAIDVNFVVGYPPAIKKMDYLDISDLETFDKHCLEVMLLSILDEHQYLKFLEEKELNFVFTSKKQDRFRVNYHFQRNNVEAIFRLVPSQISAPEKLGLPEVVRQTVIENKDGLILIAGRTGSGKSTTLGSMVELLNQYRDGIIISIEDPIEYLHSSGKCIIKQREVGRDTLSFSNAAKNALRQNPDILVIGEILDMETMDVAITAAETGALVLTSIHSADTAQALDRVASFFPAEAQKNVLSRLSLVLKGVVAQQLVPRLDKQGLVVAAEVLLNNGAMKRVIRDGDWKQIPTILQTGKSIGMQSMQESLNLCYSQGLIDGAYIREWL